MDGGLSAKWLRRLRAVAAVAAQRGMRAYIVGGAVRDLLLGSAIGDADVAVEGANRDFAAAVAVALRGEVAAQSRFGTFTLRINGDRLDIAMTRGETYAYPGALPSVFPAPISRDLARRDFSMNAMAASIMADDWGRLLDPFGGRADLRRRAVRALHPRSFADDPTRVLRAARYAARLGFSIDAATARQISRHLPQIAAVSGARLRRELELMFAERDPAAAIRLAQRLGALAAIHPALAANDAAIEAIARAAAGWYAADAQTAIQIRQDGRNDDNNDDDRAGAMFAVFAYQAPPQQLDALISRLDLDARTAAIARDAAAVKAQLPALSRPELPRSGIHRILTPFAAAAVRGCVFAAESDAGADGAIAAARMRLHIDELRHQKTLLSGDDLLALGARRGPQIGALLDRILRARLDGAATSRADELALARRWLSAACHDA